MQKRQTCRAQLASRALGDEAVGSLVARAASDRTCDRAAATETEVATEVATEPVGGCDRKKTDTCDRTSDPRATE